ncbi:plant-specific TFIIB-related protein PTF2-like [Magnolia sinica]|uniref:plant-specific TFIIB-related protein PTF2-like n=1 Tax=Magnolia sinica TaxID=86752 RepID=UPI0026595788|nr:plant-specific TFIIB-related protein PTF2-like [Magnolia sinica]
MDPTSSRFCKNCREPSIIVDPISNARVCTSCGCEQSFDNFQTQAPRFADGPQGTFVHIGEFNYKERKRFDARNQIDDISSSLSLSAQRTSEVTTMIEQITDGEYGMGRWFEVLIAACAHVITRKNNLPLSISEIASITGYDVHEIGRMVGRVTEFMDLKLPDFNVVMALDRAIRNCHCFSGIQEEKQDEMAKQGRFILQCCVKWFLTTGRQPLPMVAAVLAFVSEVNVAGPTIDDIAKDIHAGVATSRRRYKELKETLVKVAQALPWGKDVTVKNLVRNAPLILQYMSMKSKEKPLDSKLTMLDLQEVASECMKKEIEYAVDGNTVGKVEDRNGAAGASSDDLEKLKLSEDCLWRTHTDFLNGLDSFKLSGGEVRAECRNKRKRGSGIVGWNEWVVKLDSNKRLSLEQILEKNVGFDALPPSFVAGTEACRRRREKINAAKLRIDEIRKPTTNGSVVEKHRILKKQLQTTKECQNGAERCNIDSEDCIIELLLLHQVKEEEIEQGNYNRLLDLHVFNSSSPHKAFAL